VSGKFLIVHPPYPPDAIGRFAWIMSALRHAVAARYRFIPQVLPFLIHAVSEASPAASPPPPSA
jgi:hypothetical protein